MIEDQPIILDGKTEPTYLRTKYTGIDHVNMEILV